MTEPLVVARPELVVIESADVASIVVATNASLVASRSDSLTVVQSEKREAVVSERVDRWLLAHGNQGPEGRPGSGSVVTVQKTAAVAVGGHRAVILNADDQVDYADNTVLSHRDVLFGLTTGAAAAGDLATIQTTGELTEPSWNWTPQQPIFLGVNGLLTQTAPSSPALFRRIVAFAVDATRVVLDFREPVTF
jgi:hypothetical protein